MVGDNQRILITLYAVIHNIHIQEQHIPKDQHNLNNQYTLLKDPCSRNTLKDQPMCSQDNQLGIPNSQHTPLNHNILVHSRDKLPHNQHLSNLSKDNNRKTRHNTKRTYTIIHNTPLIRRNKEEDY